ncbi:RNA polymerase sigma factor [Cohnella sp. GCM10027633]|uniref:RNA polymerase sigma factor n=1 Tax=unclassified Cohnella TaxID=2636738 RepID=UPI00363F205E
MDSQKDSRSHGELAELLAQVREGCEDAFDAFYAKAAPFIYGLSRKLLGDRMEAEDVCHDVLLAVIAGADKYDPARGSAEAWLAVLAKSRCMDRLRKRSKIALEQQEPAETKEETAIGLPEHRVIRKLEREALRGALAQLPGEQRQTIAAAYFGHRTHKDLADAWQVPVGTIKSRVRYGLHHMRKTMERLGWIGEEGMG